MSESEKKKTRRQWLYDNETDNIVTKETAFDLNKMTDEAALFLKLYGCKQYLASVPDFSDSRTCPGASYPTVSLAHQPTGP